MDWEGVTDGKFDGCDEGLADGVPGIQGTDERSGSKPSRLVENNSTREFPTTISIAKTSLLSTMIPVSISSKLNHTSSVQAVPAGTWTLSPTSIVFASLTTGYRLSHVRSLLLVGSLDGSCNNCSSIS